MEPRLLYLDQKDISSLAKGQTDMAETRELARMLAAGEASIVMSFAHIVETALAPVRLRARVTEFVDRTVKPRRWLYDFAELSKAEVAYCFATDIGSKPAPLLPFHDHPMTGGLHVGPSMTFSAAVTLAGQHRDNRVSAFWDLLEQYAPSRERGRAQSANDPIPRASIRRFIYESMPAQTAAGVTLTDGCRRDYASKLDISRCPAMDLWLALLESKSHNKAAPIARSEFPDLLHVTAVPYCDAVTLDAQMHSIVSRHHAARRFGGKVARNLKAALALLRALPPGSSSCDA